MPSKYQVSPRSILRSRGALSSSNPFSIISFGVVSMVITLLGVITASLAVALALGAINSPSAFATDSASASTDVTLNLSEAIYVRILDSTATTEITKLSFDFVPTTAGVSSTSRAVVEVGTSNLTGYKLYMESNYIDPNSTISTTENPNPTPVYTTSLVNTDTDIPSSIGTIPTITPASGAGSTVKNYWYYYNPFVSPTTSSPIGDSVIPAYGSPDRIGQLSTPTDSTLTNVDISVGVDTTIAAGIYQNQLLFTAIGNPIPTAYTLSFNLDGGNAPTSSPDAFDTMTVSEVSASHTFTIPNVVPEKARYTFAYWTDEAGNQYDPGDTITVIGSSGYVGAETLTANWELIVPSFYTITTMQEMTDEVCRSVYTPGAYTSYEGTAPVIIDRASAAAGNYTATMSGTVQVPETTLIDYRGKDGTGTAANPVLTGDNVKTYTVRKLADGNCWMSEELYLPLTEGTGVEASYNNGTTFTYAPTSNAINGNTTTATYDNTERWYYNWFAATAEKGTSSSTGDVDGSICPKGWKLPYNYTTSTTLSWGDLTNAYGITTSGENTDTDTGYRILEASPISLSRAGNYWKGLFYSGGSLGRAWSSSALVYGISYYDSYVRPQTVFSNSDHGLNIRCVATRDENTIATISNMQDMNDMVCQNSNVLDNKTLTDTRDGKTYSVTKLADNNCWMTENLALDLTDSNGNPKTVTASRNDRSTFSYTPTSAASLGTNTHTPRTEAEATADGKGYAGYYYYNWYAATAEQGTASSTGDIDGSICPEGWKLPYNYTVNPSLSWGGLTDAYGITTGGANTDTTTGYQTLEASPVYLSRPGLYLEGVFYDGGKYARYWASTAQSADYAYILDLTDKHVYPQGFSYKNVRGFAIRCVAIK